MDITKVFKSKAREALFRLYFTNPDSAYYLRELERELRIPVSMLRKELIGLEKAGIFNSFKKGNLSYYSLNKKYPLFDEFKNIVFKTIGVKGLLKSALAEIKGIESAFIYGSFAKGDDDAASDIDLFIIGNINEDILIAAINSIEKRLKREINYSLYSRKDFNKKRKDKDPFVTEVIKNAKIFLVGKEHDI
ncbi:MAG: nucleotidyltransferase domain-containing protein [Candidatus Omnitrophota bacterium]